MFEHIFIEAPDLETACREAVDDVAQPWGDDAELCFDDARSTTIAQAVEIPEHLFPELRSGEEGNRHVLSEVLYDSAFDLVAIPDEFADATQERRDRVGFY